MLSMRRNCLDRDREREKREREEERERKRLKEEHPSEDDFYDDDDDSEAEYEAQQRWEEEIYAEEERIREKYAADQPPLPVKDETAASARWAAVHCHKELGLLASM